MRPSSPQEKELPPRCPSKPCRITPSFPSTRVTTRPSAAAAPGPNRSTAPRTCTFAAPRRSPTRPAGRSRRAEQSGCWDRSEHSSTRVIRSSASTREFITARSATVIVLASFRRPSGSCSVAAVRASRSRLTTSPNSPTSTRPGSKGQRMSTRKKPMSSPTLGANTITVERADGQSVTYDPRRLKGLNAYKETAREFATGERIQFTGQEKELKVPNRDLGTITSIKPGQMTVRLAGGTGRSITFDPDKVRGLDHCYAVTSHCSQGLTERRVIVNVDTTPAATSSTPGLHTSPSPALRPTLASTRTTQRTSYASWPATLTRPLP